VRAEIRCFNTRRQFCEQRVGNALEQQLHRHRQCAHRIQPLQYHEPQNHLRAIDAAPDLEVGLLLKIFQNANREALLVQGEEVRAVGGGHA
jgi:hypothetical protein